MVDSLSCSFASVFFLTNRSQVPSRGTHICNHQYESSLDKSTYLDVDMSVIVSNNMFKIYVILCDKVMTLR